MPIHTYWENDEKKVILQVYDGKWDVTDLHQTFDQLVAFSKEVGRPIIVITDMSNARMAPVNALTILSRLERVFSNHVHMDIIVGANSYLKTLSNVATQIAPQSMAKIHFVNTREQAHEIILKQTPKSADD